MGKEIIPESVRLDTFEHWCLNPDNCSDVIVERAKIGRMAKVRKLVIMSADGKYSRIVPNLEEALHWAERNNVTIPSEDIEKCRLLIS